MMVLTHWMKKRPLLLIRRTFQRRRSASAASGSTLELQHYVSLDQTGRRSTCGPLGTELKRNVLQQWWSAVVSSKPQVIGISTHCSSTDGGALKIVDGGTLRELRDLPEKQLKEKLEELSQYQGLRTGLLQGRWRSES